MNPGTPTSPSASPCKANEVSEALSIVTSWSAVRSFHPHLDGGLADGDAVAVFQVDTRILAECSLFRCLAFFTSCIFFPVHMGAIEAAEIAQGGNRRAGFEEEVMAAPASLWAACFEMPSVLPISL